MSDRKISNVTKNLMQGREIISRPENWCKDQFRKTSEKGFSYCARGAVRQAANIFIWNRESAANQLIAEEEWLLAESIPSDFQFGRSHYFGDFVAIYNNSPDVTHEDILALFDKAIIKSTQKDHE